MGSGRSKPDIQLEDPKSLAPKLKDVPPDLVDDMLEYFTTVHFWNNLRMMSMTDGFTPPILIYFWCPGDLVEKMVRSQASKKWTLLKFEHSETNQARLNLLKDHVARLYQRGQIFAPTLNEFTRRSSFVYQTVHEDKNRGLCLVDVFKPNSREEMALVGRAESLQEIASRRVVNLYKEDPGLYHYFMKRSCPVMWKRKKMLHPTFGEAVDSCVTTCKYGFMDAVESRKTVVVTPTTRTCIAITADDKSWAFYSFDPLHERTLKDVEAQLWLAHKTNPRIIYITIHCGSLGEVPFQLHKDKIERIDVLYPQDITVT